MNKIQLASKLEATLLAPHASPQDINQMAHHANQLGCGAVCVNGIYIAQVASQLKSSPTKICGVADFPLGSSKPTIKAIEATTLAKDGAHEIDIVAHLALLLAADLQAIKANIIEVTKAVRSFRSDIVIKVIIETAALIDCVSEDQANHRIATACKAIRETGGDYVKTSTGFHPAGGASVEAVQYLKKHSQGLYIKAAGGIRTYQQATALIDAGADRIGTSAPFDILKDCPQD